MELDSDVSTGVISQFKIAAREQQDKVVDAARKISTSMETAVTSLISDATGGNEVASGKLFAFCLFNYPLAALYPFNLNALFADMRPTSIKDFVEMLPSGERLALRKSIKLGSGTYADVSEKELIEKLKKSKVLVDFLAPKATASNWKADPIDVNPGVGLNLLLLQPAITKVVMEKRKRDTELMLARATPLVAGPMGPIGPEILLTMTRSMGGGADLDPSMPIDMRGAGPMLASMKAGFFPFAIGTGISPSQWRPVGDVAFISGQLKMAYNSLVERLEKMTGKSSNSPRFALSNEVQEKVDDAIKNLETAEKEVKERRDELTKYNEMISSGQSKVGPFTPAKVLTPDSIKKSVELYNEAQKNRHRYEMKVFRVISTLGLKLESMA